MSKISKFILMFTSFLLCFNSVNAQEKKKEEKENKIIEKLSISPQLGMLHSWGDFKKDGFMPSFLQGNANEFGLGLYLNYNFRNYLSFSTGIIRGELEGRNDEVNSIGAKNEPRDLGIGILFRTNLFEFTLPRIDFNVTRLIFKDRSEFFNKFSIGILASHGLVFYDSKIYAQGDPNVNLEFPSSSTSRKEIRGSTNKTTEAVTSFGGKLSYIINNRFDINLESSIRVVNNDKLDAWEGGEFNDAYSFTAIGATYHLKKRKYITKKFYTEEDKLLAKESSKEEIIEEKETLIESEPINEVEEEEIVDMEIDESETIFGKYVYKELPMTSTALVVLDENGNPIDTIYTDANGFFSYEKLSSDQIISLKPIDIDKLDGDDIALYLEDEKGEKTKEFKFVGSKEENVVIEEKVVEEKVIELSDDEGYYVAVAAFRKKPSSIKMVEILEKKGETPVIIRNLKGTWNLIAISKHSTKEEALAAMKKARENGFSKAWVHIKIR